MESYSTNRHLPHAPSLTPSAHTSPALFPQNNSPVPCRPDIPFPDASFDLIMMECTLTLFAHPVQVLREAHRVLRSGGSLFISALANRSDATDTPTDASTLASTSFSTDTSGEHLTENDLLHTDALCLHCRIYRFIIVSSPTICYSHHNS